MTVEANIKTGIDDSYLDVDENGSADRKDGIMVIRYMVGRRGNALISDQSTASPAMVEDNIEALMPASP